MLICLLPSVRGHTSNSEVHSEKYAFSLGFHHDKIKKTFLVSLFPNVRITDLFQKSGDDDL